MFRKLKKVLSKRRLKTLEETTKTFIAWDSAKNVTDGILDSVKGLNDIHKIKAFCLVSYQEINDFVEETVKKHLPEVKIAKAEYTSRCEQIVCPYCGKVHDVIDSKTPITAFEVLCHCNNCNHDFLVQRWNTFTSDTDFHAFGPCGKCKKNKNDYQGCGYDPKCKHRKVNENDFCENLDPVDCLPKISINQKEEQDV